LEKEARRILAIESAGDVLEGGKKEGNHRKAKSSFKFLYTGGSHWGEALGSYSWILRDAWIFFLWKLKLLWKLYRTDFS